MGGNSKGGSQTVGFKYKMGIHAVLSQTGLDRVMALRFGDETAWEGSAMDTRVSVNKPNLFGGKEREGGVSGFFDVMSGKADQQNNDYLDEQLDGLVPAFRGVVSIVFRHFYWGNNPYIKTWEMKAQNIFSTYENWLPQYAPCNVESTSGGFALWIALDTSGSMQTANKLEIAKANIISFLDTLPIATVPIIAVAIAPWSGSPGTRTIRLNLKTQADVDALKTAVDAIQTDGDTDFATAFDGANDFFNSTAPAVASSSNGIFARLFRSAYSSFISAYNPLTSSLFGSGESNVSQDLSPIMVFITDGNPNEGTLEAAIVARDAMDITPQVIGVNINNQDTQFTDQLTSSGKTTIIDGSSDTQLAQALSSGVNSFADLNGVHIIRDLLVNPALNGNGDSSSIGASFEPAAKLAFDEGMGFSFFHATPGDRQSFMDVVKSHLNAEVYLSVETGKWEINLIRNNYVIADLFTFDKSIITEWTVAPVTPKAWELVNHLTLTYTRRDTGKTNSISASNPAALLANQGQKVADEVDLTGITFDDLAAFVAERELQARGLPITTGAFRAAYLPADLNLGDVIRVNDPRMEIYDMVCRIKEIEEPDGLDNSVLIRFATDPFAVNRGDFQIRRSDTDVVAVAIAKPSPYTLAIELPFYQLIQQVGETDLLDQLVINPDLGYWGAAAATPGSGHINTHVDILEDDGLYTFLGSSAFLPLFHLDHSLSANALDNTFTTTQNGSESEIGVGDLIYMGNEIIRVDSISLINGEVVWAVGRGCLDTVPEFHDRGTALVEWAPYLYSDGVEYITGQSVTLKLPPAIKSGPLSLELTEEQNIVFNNRAIRPYPVGQLQVEGEYEVTAKQEGSVTATWAHRDRLFQTTAAVEDFTANDIGPEPGTTYSATLKFFNVITDFFDTDDLYSRGDFYAKDDPESSQEISLANPDATSATFSVESFDFFSQADVFAASNWFQSAAEYPLSHAVFCVTSSRDGYENWQSANIWVPLVVAPPPTVFAPTNLQGTVVPNPPTNLQGEVV